MTPGIICIFGKRGSGKTSLAKSLSLSSEYPRVIIIDPLWEYEGEKIASLFTFQESRFKSEPFRVIYHPPEPIERAHFIFGLAMGLQNVCVVMEEIDLLCSPHDTPRYLSDCIRRGRHFGVSIICTTRRPSEVSRLLTSQASEFYIFKFSEPRDLDYFQSTFGQDIVTQIKALEEHGYIRKII